MDDKTAIYIETKSLKVKTEEGEYLGESEGAESLPVPDNIIGFVDILGETYKIIKYKDCEENPKGDAMGYCDPSSKTLAVVTQKDHSDLDLPEVYDKKILRHEIMHAAFFESGLASYANDEELVDWLSIQFDKLKRIVEKAEEMYDATTNQTDQDS